MNDENQSDDIEDADYEENEQPSDGFEHIARKPTGSMGGDLDNPSSDERVWAAVAHATGVASGLMLPILICLLIYMMKKDESEFIAIQSKEALNFQITTAIAVFVSALMVFCVIGIPMLWVVGLGSFILAIVGAIKAHGGERYRYPVNLRLIE